MAKKRGKGFFGAIGKALGSIPVVAKVKKAAKTVKNKIKTAKKKLKNTVKKILKKVKKKIGKVYTKARKIKNNLSKSKIVRKIKRAVKKAVLATKKAVKKVKAVVSKAKQKVKAVVKQTKKVMKEKVLPAMKKAGKALSKVAINAVKPKNLLDGLQLGLDIVGLIPVAGEIADGLNGLIYLARGDKLNAALSFGAMIPVAGWVAVGGKWVNKGVKTVKNIKDANKGLIDRATEMVKKQVETVKTQINSKVAEVKQQLSQLGAPQMQLAGAGVGRVSDTGPVVKNTPTSSPKPSNSQPPQKGSNSKIVVEKYGKLKNDKSTSGQAHHLNQDAAFKTVIPKKEGMSIKLEGNAFKDVGTPHFNAHKTMEEFWSQYRKGGEKHLEIPTCGEYTKALYKSLQDAGLSKEDAFNVTKEAIKQRREYGLTYDMPVPRVPNPMNSLNKYLFKNIP